MRPDPYISHRMTCSLLLGVIVLVASSCNRHRAIRKDAPRDAELVQIETAEGASQFMEIMGADALVYAEKGDNGKLIVRMSKGSRLTVAFIEDSFRDGLFDYVAEDDVVTGVFGIGCQGGVSGPFSIQAVNEVIVVPVISNVIVLDYPDKERNINISRIIAEDVLP